jgi:hypothetical protein
MAKETTMDELSSFWMWTLAGVGTYALVCGGFGAYVSDERGRSWFEGLMFGLFLGPMGVVAAGCLPDERKTRVDKNQRYSARAIQDRIEEEEDKKMRDTLAQMQPIPPIIAHQARRLLGEVEEPKPRRPKGEG